MPAKIQAVERSLPVRLIRILRAQITLTAVAAKNNASAEYTRGLYSHAWATWPLSKDNAPLVKPHVGHGRPVKCLIKQSCTGRWKCALSQTSAEPKVDQTNTNNTAQSGHRGRREMWTISIFIFSKLVLSLRKRRNDTQGHEQHPDDKSDNL